MLAVVKQRKAALLMQQQQLTLAAETLLPAVNTLKQLNSISPRDITIREATIDALLLSADLSAMQNDPNSASHCESARTLLRPLIVGSTDFQLLAAWVKAHACLNQSDQVIHVKKQLEMMSYRDATYLRYISTHPQKKVNS